MRASADIVLSAAQLLSDDGENPEYDRAVTELTSDLLGVSFEHKPTVLLCLRNVQKAGNPVVVAEVVARELRMLAVEVGA